VSVRTRLGAVRREIEARRFERRLAAPRLLRAFAAAHPDAVFVEIGANDGEQHDHLRPFILSRRWTGVMVEPVPYIFARLQANYAGIDRVRLENAAVGARDGTLPFWFLVDAPADERSRLPDWYDGIGSFSREALLGHAVHIPDIAERVVCQEVPTLTFASLCAKHGLGHVDLLVVDTEGHDWEIIRTADLGAWRPELIVYEHFHLSPADRAACAEHVRGLGYRTLEEGFDTLCLREGAHPQVELAWSRLKPAIPGLSVHDERR
jgi:FkbM family methyltransferase